MFTSSPGVHTELNYCFGVDGEKFVLPVEAPGSREFKIQAERCQENLTSVAAVGARSSRLSIFVSNMISLVTVYYFVLESLLPYLLDYYSTLTATADPVPTLLSLFFFFHLK